MSLKLNEEDDHGVIPLDIALKSRQEELAKSLVEHNVNLDQIDSNGSSLLHLAVDRGTYFLAASKVSIYMPNFRSNFQFD